MEPTAPTTGAPSPTPFNNGAPLTQDQIQKIRLQAGIDTNPHTASATIPVQQRLAMLQAGTYSHATPVNTNQQQNTSNNATGGVLSAPDFQSPANDITTGIKDAAVRATQNEDKGTFGGELQAAGNLAEGGLSAIGGVAKGAGNILSSMIPNAIKDWLFQTKQADPSDPKAGIITEKLTQAYSQWAAKHPEASTDLGNIASVAGIVGGEAAEPAVGKAGESAIEGAAKVPEAAGKGFRKALTPLPPAINNTVSTAEDAKAATNFIKEAQSTSQEAQKGAGSITHPQKVGESLFGEQGKVTQALTEAKNTAGEKMGTALKTLGVGDAKVDASEALAKHDAFVKDSSLERRVATLPASQRNLYNQFKDSLYELRAKGGATLQQTDNFLREWQGRTSTDPTLNKAITNTTHDINEAAKTSADAAEDKLNLSEKIKHHEDTHFSSIPEGMRSVAKEAMKYDNVDDFVNEMYRQGQEVLEAKRVASKKGIEYIPPKNNVMAESDISVGKRNTLTGGTHGEGYKTVPAQDLEEIYNKAQDIRKGTEDIKTGGNTSHPYRESNDEYRRVITPFNQLKDVQSGGYKSGITGANSANADLMKGLTEQTGRTKGLMDDVRSLVGDKAKVGGLTMNDQAQLSQFIHDIYNGVDPKTALSKMSVSISPVMSGLRTGLKFIGSNATSPDTIIQRMIDVLHEAS